MARVARQIVTVGRYKRLAYFRETADAAFWDEHWRGRPVDELYENARLGKLGGSYDALFVRHLPRSGRILEAGCGLGQIVVALRARGYDVEGVEWAVDAVETIRAKLPDIPVRVGDATALDVPDAFYAGYISLGVMEHREEGPEPFLKEAHRVLADGGIALISVPYFNSLRRLKARLGFYGKPAAPAPFYQYAFTGEEFTSLVERAGFQVVERAAYSGDKGVKDEILLFRKVFQWPGVGWRAVKVLRSGGWLERKLGHMMLFVCRKVRPAR